MNDTTEEAVAKVVDGSAWAEFCGLLAKAGAVVTREDLETTAFDRAEGLRYLSRLLRAGLASFVEATGPAHPLFRPLPDLVKMGLDNPDNYYVSAPIDARHDYRIRGRRQTIHYLSFAAQNQNFAARDRITGGAGHLNDSELALEPDGSFEIEIARETGVAAGALPVLVGDSDDAAFLDALTRRTHVVCTAVGPYAKYGSGLVAACAANGTDYCDLTGEVHWMQRMIETHQDVAAASGARIVFSCGFDCIPSDVGVLFLQREMRARHGVACARVQFRVGGFSGGASGGTVASMLLMLEEAERDPAVMRTMNDPYALNPKGERVGPDGPERTVPAWDAAFRQWTAPFVMAGIDTKVVRRTNALLRYAYGKDFCYDEAVLMGAGPLGFAKATATSLGTAAVMGAMRVGPLRRAVSGRLPQPGDGPSKQKREAGYFDIHLRGEHPTDARKSLRGRIRGDRDPGYGSTAKMLGESAVCLAKDALPAAGGCWTPASALGEPLLARLGENAGVTFRIEV